MPSKSSKKVEPEIPLPTTIFDNDCWYPFKHNSIDGIIAYVGSEGVISVNEYGKKALGLTYSCYKPLLRKTGNVNITFSKKNWCTYYRIIATIALQVEYADTESLQVEFRDGNRNNVTIQNMLLRGTIIPGGIPTPMPKIIEDQAKQKLVPPNPQVSKDIVETLIKLGSKQKLPTDLFTGSDYFPLHIDQNSGVIIYVGKDGVLSVDEYGKKIIGHQHAFLTPHSDLDGYKIISVTRNSTKYNFKLNRLLVAATLGITLSDISNYDVIYRDKDGSQTDINNMRLSIR